MSGSIGQNTGQPSFVPRKVRVIFRLLGHSFGTTGADTVTLDGLHVQADITQAQFPAAESATVRLQGVQPDLINRLSLAAPNLNTQNASELTLASLQPDGTVAVVFQGGVTLAYADYTNAPENSFVVQAFSSALPNALAAPPTSFKGRVPASQLMGAIASKAGLRFVNYGVQAMFYNPYCYGSPGQQLAQCLETTPMRVGLGRGQLSVMAHNAGYPKRAKWWANNASILCCHSLCPHYSYAKREKPNSTGYRSFCRNWPYRVSLLVCWGAGVAYAF
ncbi:Burkholderia phage Bcep781 gp50 [Acetobacter orientalis]|uniref:Burkholderia phage Bcep781 gp50 n=1 Tax=Acetobacter orientalis TaxID=146474 RepID=A0A2Z5ZJU1_9PROT|nr:Burkholderia phage Bcep781 gp50 [Acetobacter orientalis]